jgi:hypothetical protein
MGESGFPRTVPIPWFFDNLIMLNLSDRGARRFGLPRRTKPTAVVSGV